MNSMVEEKRGTNTGRISYKNDLQMSICEPKVENTDLIIPLQVGHFTHRLQ